MMPQVWHMDSKGPSIPNSGAVTQSAWAGMNIQTETGTFYNVSQSNHPIVTFLSVDQLKWINDFVFLVLQ